MKTIIFHHKDIFTDPRFQDDYYAFGRIRTYKDETIKDICYSFDLKKWNDQTSGYRRTKDFPTLIWDCEVSSQEEFLNLSEIISYECTEKEFIQNHPEFFI